MRGSRVVQKRLVAAIVLGLSGLALALEGFYFSDGSGLLFGEYICFAGAACNSGYEYLRSIFWLGIYLLLPGLVLMVTAVLFLGRMWRERLEGEIRFFASQGQKRVIIISACFALMIILAFLAPVVPFSKTYPDFASLESFPRVDVCYSISSASPPVIKQLGFESITRSLFGIGNFVWVQCTVS